MKCKVRLFHVESDTKWTVKKEFGYDTKNAGWAKQKLLYSKLMKYDTITFRGEVEIISLLDVRGNKTMFNNGKRTFVASMDDGNMGRSSATKKTSFIGRANRSKTTGNVHQQGPYGGYGSHNYQDYFDDGYKEMNRQREERMKQLKMEEERKRKEEEEDNEDDDDDGDEEEMDSTANESEDSESSEEELKLVTFQDLRDQTAFLAKEWKKLNKIIQSLKQKSMSNDAKIQQLKSYNEMIKTTSTSPIIVGNVAHVGSTGNVNGNMNGNVTMSPKAIATAGPSGTTAMNGDKASGDLFDLLGGMSTTPSSGQKNTPQTQNNVTFGTGGDTGSAMAGWTTF